MKKTKIICTMGPNTDDPELLAELIRNGMNVARFNFSHGTHESQKASLERLKKVREELGVPVAAMLDTKGPEIRTGLLEGGQAVTLSEGQNFTLTTRDVTGCASIVQISYEGLVKDVCPGSRILIDDGLLELEVEEAGETDIVCQVRNSGVLGERKGVNVPGVKLGLPALTQKDIEDIRFAIEQGFDFIAASFVRNGDAVKEIRAILNEAASPIKIISKIENAEGIENLDDIIRHSDGIMVARGDMGVEIAPEEVPHIQKMIIRKCNQACKTVITATQMLDSMIRNPRPTRAEVTDVANAVYDGTDVVMLSGETAMGHYPVEALRMMVHICEEAESYLDYSSYRERIISDELLHTITNAVCHSSVSTAHDLGAAAIIAPTFGGFTARMLSKWRPDTPILALSPNDSTVRQLQMLWGVVPYKAKRSESTDDLISDSIDLLMEQGMVRPGDIVVVAAGVINPMDHTPASDTNIMRVIELV